MRARPHSFLFPIIFRGCLSRHSLPCSNPYRGPLSSVTKARDACQAPSVCVKARDACQAPSICVKARDACQAPSICVKARDACQAPSIRREWPL